MTSFTSSEHTVPGHSFRALVHRAGSGRPIVFLHGAGGFSPSDPFALALAERFQVVAPVHPGFRDLDELDELRDVHDLALYHDDLLGALDLDGVPVVGHSFGGMVAAELAAHVPARVSHLALLAPVGLWRDEEPMADLFTAFPFEVQDLLWADPTSEAATSAAAAMAEGANEDGVDDPMLATLLAMVKGLTTAGKYLWPIPDKGLGRRLHRITASTLVVFGAKDKLVPPSYGEDFVAGIPAARLEILDDAGHMVPFERLADVVDLVSDLVAS